jgi:hypothetical protein
VQRLVGTRKYLPWRRALDNGRWPLDHLQPLVWVREFAGSQKRRRLPHQRLPGSTEKKKDQRVSSWSLS